MNKPVECDRCGEEVTCSIHEEAEALKDGLCAYCNALTDAALFIQGFDFEHRMAGLAEILEAVQMYDEFDAEDALEATEA